MLRVVVDNDGSTNVNDNQGGTDGNGVMSDDGDIGDGDIVENDDVVVDGSLMFAEEEGVGTMGLVPDRPFPHLGLRPVSGDARSNMIPNTNTHVSASTWTGRARYQALKYCTLAGVCAGCNERAALHYQRLDKWGLTLVAILTVVVGGKGATEVVGTSNDNFPRAVSVILGLCSIALGICGGLMSRLGWKGKRMAFAKRAVGYMTLAEGIRITLTQSAHRRPPAPAYLASLLERISKLEDTADPLPLRFRQELDVHRGIISMWSTPGDPALRAVALADDNSVVGDDMDPMHAVEGVETEGSIPTAQPPRAPLSSSNMVWPSSSINHLPILDTLSRDVCRLLVARH